MTRGSTTRASGGSVSPWRFRRDDLARAMAPPRPRAHSPSGRGTVPWGPLGLLLLAPGGALIRTAFPEHTLAAGVAAVAASGLTYLLYAEDKQRAQLGVWRIPESVLQLGALGGGWPGAFAAQRRLRHKTAKPRFLFVFWLIVATHQVVALDCLFAWPVRDALLSIVRAG